ncbi:MAG TPA: APC family permease [Fimbriimonas sp.]|nr:APC family permease [Fimbriimonas sp.]
MVPGHQLERKRVGVWTLAATIFFVVNGGPYTTEQVVGKSGPLFGLLVLLLIPIFWALPVALLTAELSSAFPEEGGYYVWVKKGLGPFAGFLCAWYSWLSSWVDLALYPLLAVEYGSRLFVHGGQEVPHRYLWVLGLIVAFTVLNLLGVRVVGLFSDGLLVLLFAPFLMIFFLGLFRISTQPIPHIPLLNPKWTWQGLGMATVYALWNYFGWDSLTTTSGEVDQASRKFPKAILLAVGMVTAMVVLPVAAGIVLKTDWPNWDSDAGYWPEIASAAWPGLVGVVIVGGAISNVGLFAANLLASSRIPYVLAADRFLPAFIFREHPKFKTPWVGILLAGIFSALLARDSFENLVGVDLALYLGALMLEFATLLVLRKRGALDGAHFRIPGGFGLLVPLVLAPTIIALGAIILQLSPSLKLSDLPVSPAVLALLMFATGPIVYGVSRKFAK